MSDPRLTQNLQNLLRSTDSAALKASYHGLSESYRANTDQDASPAHLTRIQGLAYVAARLPATMAVQNHVFAQLSTRACAGINTLLDIGSGPGTAAWTALAAFPNLTGITLIEHNNIFLGICRGLTAGHPLQDNLHLQHTPFPNLAAGTHKPRADCVLLSYMLNEQPAAKRMKVIQAAWDATSQFLIVIEPGTPTGFMNIRTARQALIDQGGHCIAPCLHNETCPMSASDWCHFSARVPRDRQHKAVKSGTLDYEDEKYSYLIMGKTSHAPTDLMTDHGIDDPITPQGRLVKKPRLRKGHVIMSLCTASGLVEKVVSKSDKELYKRVKKKSWGDVV